jgi:iron complex outermembrane receptor protein
MRFAKLCESFTPGSFMRVRSCIALAAIAAIGCPVAWAQVAAPEAPASAPLPGQLTTITVTAERRAENAKDVPSTVSTLRGEALDVLNSSGEDVRMLSGRVPSLNIESSFGRAFPRFYIRGYGNTDFRLNASQPVSLVYDDVVQENPILKGFPAFDLEAVEVLAGPQGTLFGRNTPAGVVKFDSVKPSQTREGYFSLGAGRFSTANVEGGYTVPLSSEWSARLAVQSQHRKDWVHNEFAAGPSRDFEGYDDSAGRLQFLYQPSAAFSALFNVHARDLDGSARLFRANIIKPGSNDLVDGFDERKVSIDGSNYQKLSTVGGSARLKWALGGVNLYSITGYESVRADSRGDVDGGFGAVFAPPSGPGLIPFPSETSDAIRDHRQWSQEFRVESAQAGPFKWQAGVYFFDEAYEINSRNFDTLGGGAQSGLLTTHQKSRSWAVFGSVGYDVTPLLQVRAGLRYTKDKKNLDTRADYEIQEANGLATGTSDSKASWDLAGIYKLTPDVNLYARAATGYRGSSILPPGQFNPLSTAKPETITSIEVGVKADLFERRARVAFDVFRYEVKNQQLTEVGGGGNSNSLKSAKKVVGQGVELSADAYLTDNLLLSLSGSINDTTIKDPALAVSGCGGGCTVTNPSAGNGAFFIDGNPLPQAPKYIANVNLRYGIPTANGEWYVYTDWSYRSKVNFFLYESVEFTGKALTVGGLRVGYIWGNGKYEAAVFGRNITDKVVAVGAIDFNNLTGFINEPRTWGVQFRASF